MTAKLTPTIIEEILADPAFHRNLEARTVASTSNSHPEDAKQNVAAAAIITQREVVRAARGTSNEVPVPANLQLAILLVVYIKAYFPSL